MIFIVLGMHKSGTTLVAQSLHRSGINMGWDITEEHFTYHGNHCESPYVNKINDRLLDTEDKLSFNTASLASGQPDQTAIHRIRDFINKQNQLSPTWGTKDPRLCVTYPVWREFLPSHKLIVIFRHPCEVAFHYLRHAPRREKLSRYLKSLRSWAWHNGHILEILHQEDAPDFFACEYGHLMRSEETFQRLSTFVGQSLTDMRDPEKYHQHLSEKSMRLFICCQLFKWGVFDIDSIWARLQLL